MWPTLVKPADTNCLSAMQFAVDVLKVKHIITFGHYGCSDVEAVLSAVRLGLVDNWLAEMHVTQDKYRAELESYHEERTRHDMLCELNVIGQVANTCRSTVVQSAWRRGQELAVQGWIYGLTNGRIRELGVSQQTPKHLPVAMHKGAPKLSPTCAALLTAREKVIATRATISTSSPDNMWGQDYGT
jgi:carbonic anhydrase